MVRRARPWAAAVMGLATFVALLPLARLDFDRHHDGYLLAQAMAVHDGFAIQRDAFAQYGPVTPWLQSLALLLPTGPALALRLSTALLIAVTVFLIADLGRVSPQRWPSTNATSRWAAATWVVLADVWSGVAMLPWPSVVAAALGVAILYGSAASLQQAELGHRRRAVGAVLLAGILAGALPFTRLTIGLAALAVLAVLGVATLWRGRGLVRRLPLWGLAGAALSSSAILATLALTGAVDSYVQQSIMWPMAWAGDAAETWQTSDGLSRILLEQLGPVAICLFVLALHWWLRHRAGESVIIRRTVLGSTVFAGVAIAAIVGRRLVDALAVSGWNGWTDDLPIALYAVSVEFLNFFLCLIIALSVITFGYAVIRWLVQRRIPLTALPWLLLAGLALAFLVQVLPTYDNRHIWWGSPIGLLLAFAIVGRLGSVNRLTGNPLIPAVITMAIVSLSAAVVHVRLDRVPGSEGTVIAGMLVRPPVRDAIDEDTRLLVQALPHGSSALYLVADGDVSVLGLHYRSIDAHFVGWGNPPPLSDRLAARPPIVISSDTGDAELRSLAASLGYVIAAGNDRITVLLPVDETP